MSSDTSFAMLTWAGGASTAATAEHRNLLCRSRLVREKFCRAKRCYTSRADYATADTSKNDHLCMTILRHSKIQGDLPTEDVLRIPDVGACLMIWKVSQQRDGNHIVRDEP